MTNHEIFETFDFPDSDKILNDKGRSKFPGVYTIKTASSPKVYVGSTGDLYARKINHEWYLSRNKHHNRSLQNSYNKHGSAEFFFLITTNREEAYDIEQKAIDSFSKKNLLHNVATDARYSGVNFKHTPETIAKLRQWSTGRKHSDDAKRKIGVASRLRGLGKIMSEETKEKISRGRTGKRHTLETIEKIRTRAKGRRLGMKNVYSEDGWRRMKELGQRRAKHVVVMGQEYDSISDAAKAYKIHYCTAKRRLNSDSFREWNYL